MNVLHPVALRIERDDLSRPDVVAMLGQHLQEMAAASPPESCHALDVEALRGPAITFWTAWESDRLAGCCALKDLGAGHGEIKSMRTADELRGSGVAAAMLQHLLRVADDRGWRRLSLETGAQDVFAPARRLYARFGFVAGPPFGDYRPDPLSVFMTRELV